MKRTYFWLFLVVWNQFGPACAVQHSCQAKADRPCWCELRLACFGWSFYPPPLSSQAALQPQNLAHGGVDENLFKIEKYSFKRQPSKTNICNEHL